MVLCEQVSFAVDAGQVVHVLGKNGVGKSTLLLMLAGVLPHDVGEMSWSSQLPHEWSTLFIGHKTGMNPELTVMQNVRYLLALHTSASLPSAVIEDALAWAGLAGHEGQLVNKLSSGQTRRAQLARLFVDVHHTQHRNLSKRLWLLDEPLTAIDSVFSERLQALMMEFLSRDGRIILTSHQPLTHLQHQDKQMIQCLDLDEYPVQITDGMMVS